MRTFSKYKVYVIDYLVLNCLYAAYCFYNVYRDKHFFEI